MSTLPDLPTPGAENFHAALQAAFTAWKARIESNAPGDHSHGESGTVISIVANEAALGTGSVDGESRITANDGHRHTWSVTTETWTDHGTPPNPLPAAAETTGGIQGLEFARTGDNEITLQPGTCRDSRGDVDLTLSSATAVAIPNADNGIYHVFLGDDETLTTSTDIAGGDTGYSVQRRVALGLNYPTGNRLFDFTHKNGLYLLNETLTLGAGTGAVAAYDASAVLPLGCIGGVGVNSNRNGSSRVLLQQHGDGPGAGITHSSTSIDTTVHAWVIPDTTGIIKAWVPAGRNLYANGFDFIR